VVVALGVAVGILFWVGVSVIIGVLAGILVFFRFSSDRRKSNNIKTKDALTPNRIDRASIMINLFIFRWVCFINQDFQLLSSSQAS
jgi:prolipoprotein diacylglyceryltransferase